jgi:diaminopimelate decarboxylase
MSRESVRTAKVIRRRKETPFLFLDLDIINSGLISQACWTQFPYAKPYYAVKACPHDKVVETLRDLGSSSTSPRGGSWTAPSPRRHPPTG